MSDREFCSAAVTVKLLYCDRANKIERSRGAVEGSSSNNKEQQQQTPTTKNNNKSRIARGPRDEV
jgi:hypothetical protein